MGIVDDIVTLHQDLEHLPGFCTKLPREAYSPYLISLVYTLTLLQDYIEASQTEGEIIREEIKKFINRLRMGNREGQEHPFCPKIKNRLSKTIHRLDIFIKRILCCDPYFEKKFRVEPLRTQSEIVLVTKVKNRKEKSKLLAPNPEDVLNMTPGEFRRLCVRIQEGEFKELDVKRYWNLDISEPYLSNLRFSLLKGGYLVMDEELLKEVLQNDFYWRKYSSILSRYALSEEVITWDEEDRRTVEGFLAVYNPQVLDELKNMLMGVVDKKDFFKLMAEMLVDARSNFVDIFFPEIGWDIGELYVEYHRMEYGIYRIGRLLERSRFLERFSEKLRARGIYTVEKLIEETPLFFELFTYGLVVSLFYMDTYEIKWRTPKFEK